MTKRGAEYRILSPERAGAAINGRRSATPPWREVVLMVTYTELFQLCLVLIGFAGLIIQISKKK